MQTSTRLEGVLTPKINGAKNVSHFSVLVITDREPTNYLLTKILQPWHEYECTGKEDQYVIDVDVTEDCEKTFNKPQKVVQLEDGSVHDYYDEQFWKPENDDKFAPKAFSLPFGGRLIEDMPADEARKHGIGYKDMEDCVESEWGGFIRDGRCYRKTNPNKKWDWWVVGGRWSGMLEPYGDSVRLGDMDIPAMQDAEVAVKLPEYDVFQAIVAGRPAPDWDTVREETVAAGGTIEQAREKYWNDPVILDLKAAPLFKERWDLNRAVKQMNCTREKFIERTRKQTLQSFAVVKDGKWYERGDMGWWGVVIDEKDIDTWDDEFTKMIESLPPDTWLTVVDCHI